MLRDLPQQSLQLIIYVTTIAIAFSSWLLIFWGHYGQSAWLIGNSGYIIITGACMYWRRPLVVSYLLTSWYVVVGGALLSMWTINLAAGILLLGMSLGVATILFGGRAIIYTTIAVVGVIGSIHVAVSAELFHPDISVVASEETIADVIIYTVLFVSFALMAWLARRYTEQALKRARVAEEDMAAQLQNAHHSLAGVQLAEVRQLYQLSALGDASAAALHEIANQLAVTILDLELLHTHSPEVQQVKEDILQLEAIVTTVRRRIKKTTSPQRVMVTAVLRETILRLHQRYPRSVIHVHGLRRSQLYIKGDSLLLSQVIYTLVSNALEAPARRSVVNIELTCIAHKIVISITNQAHLSMMQRKQLFQPTSSTKPNGMGIGLFIAKQLIEVHLRGTLELDPRGDRTTFTIRLPQGK